MGHRKNRGHRPPYVNEEFAAALTGENDFSRQRKENHKALQLCRQVQRAIALALPEGDEVLGDLYIAEVTPAPDAGHLLVHVMIPVRVSIVDALKRLEEFAPRLRAEVARAITRKRAPEISFIPCSSQEGAP
jgi:ribosome-binding factor A